MTENDKLDLILTEIDGIKAEIGGMKAEIGMHIENHTDKNILLIAENFIELTNKLNQAIPAADKNLAYQVKVDYVFEKVKVLEKDMAELKSRTA